MSRKLKDLCYVLVALSVAACFAVLTFGYVSKNPIIKDAHQTARAAYHLVHARVIGKNVVETDNPEPQMHREPVPIIVVAAVLLLHPAFDEPYTISGLTHGPLAKTIKGCVNAFWRFLAALFIFLLCWQLFSGRLLSAAMALTCLAVSEVLFFAHPGNVDRLYTEIPAAALILFASWSAVRFVREKSMARAVWLGIALGVLALTKAAFFYIAIGFIGLLAALEGVKLFQVTPSKESLKQISAAYALIALAMIATVAPWVTRNFLEIGKPQIADRGEEILGVRVLLTEQPLLGALYAFSPYGLKPTLAVWTGYSPKDLEKGGKLEDLLYAKYDRSAIFAERMKAEGFEGDEDEWLRHMALNYVIHNPLRYLASTAIFAYRGLWFMDDAWTAKKTGISAGILALFSALAVVCFLGLFFGAVLAGDQMLVAAFGLGAGSFMFISLFTYAIDRFNEPITPLVITSVLWLIVALSKKLVSLGARLKQHANAIEEMRESPRSTG